MTNDFFMYVQHLWAKKRKQTFHEKSAGRLYGEFVQRLCGSGLLFIVIANYLAHV